jgi:hypothetical protein
VIDRIPESSIRTMLPLGQPEDTPPFDELFTTESPLTDSRSRTRSSKLAASDRLGTSSFLPAR